MPNTSVRAAAEGMPAIDPAVEIGTLLGQSLDRDERFQEAQFDAGRTKRSSERTFQEAADHEQDRSLALRALLSTVQATSVEGAVMQLAETIAVVDLVRDAYPEDAFDYEAKQKFRTINRLLFSALAAVDAASKAPLATVHNSHFGTKQCDPWRDPFEVAKRRERQDADMAASIAARKGGAK